MFSKKQIIILVFLLLASSFVWYAVFRESRSSLSVSFLNVGQGDAIFIETPHGNQVLIDGGAGRRVLSELGSVMPAYDRSIDLIIATQTDLDHLGGLVEVVKNFAVGRVIENGYKANTQVFSEWEKVLAEKRVAHDTVSVGDRIQLGDGIYLDILGPFPEDFDPEPKKANEVMVVARLVYGERSFLFTGDIERADEIRLTQSGLDIASDVLKVAHHGSKYSSTDLFLEKASPRFTVVSAGANNRYGHPHPETLDRLRVLCAKLFRTDENGRLLFSSNGSILTVPDGIPHQ